MKAWIAVINHQTLDCSTYKLCTGNDLINMITCHRKKQTVYRERFAVERVVVFVVVCKTYCMFGI